METISSWMRNALKTYLVLSIIVSFALLNPLSTGTIPDLKDNEVTTDEKHSTEVSAELSSETGKNSNEIPLLVKQAELMKSYMDPTADPCQSFYQYACGNFPNLHTIPEDRTWYGSFSIPRDQIDFILKDLVESLNFTETPTNEENASKVDAKMKLKHLYDSCMNTELLEKRGIEPMLELFNSLGGWPVLDINWKEENFNLLNMLADLSLLNYDQLIAEAVKGDLKNPNANIVVLSRGSSSSLFISDFEEGDNSTRVNAYREYVINMLKLFDISHELAVETSKEIIDFERRILEIELEMSQSRYIDELYKKFTIEDLYTMFPNFDWDMYFLKVLEKPINRTEEIVVITPEYLTKLFDITGTTEPRIITNWLLWKIVQSTAVSLDSRFDNEERKFSEALTGRKKRSPRWKLCLSRSSGVFGKVFGALYVQKYFDEESKADILELTEELRSIFSEFLVEKDWLAEPTKTLALEKLRTMELFLGYDDEILLEEKVNEEYKDIEISSDKYFENILNVGRHGVKENQKLHGEEVDKKKWGFQAYVVNAGYAMNRNRVLFPAAILQPPFYHKDFPRALNFGGIGTFIGHEITHGFDEFGWKFDKDGALRNWWDTVSIAAYNQRAECFIDQYNNYELHGQKIDGNLTLDENISDIGGLRQTYFAYKKWLEQHHGDNVLEQERLPGINLTSSQLFFLSFSQMWCANVRPEEMLQTIKTDPHSPSEIRVKGTLSNFKEFSEEFGCALGSPMNPEKKCEIW